MYKIDTHTNSLRVYHQAGFFSNLTIRLEAIIEYYRLTGTIPDSIDGTAQFELYSPGIDLVHRLFESRKRIAFVHPSKCPTLNNDETEAQYSDYGSLQFSNILPFVRHYFTPSIEVINVAQRLYEGLTSSADINKFIGVIYRGTDKSVETVQPNISSFCEETFQLTRTQSLKKIFLETDEDFVIQTFQERFGPANVLYVPRSRLRDKTNRYSPDIEVYLATIFLISRLPAIISTSGNGELWTRLFRESASRTTQFLEHKEFIYGKRNPRYQSSNVGRYIGAI